jgi:hypothetical protein
MWIYTKGRQLINLATAAEVRVHQESSSTWSIQARFPTNETVVLADAEDEGGAENLKNRVFQKLKDGANTLDLRFS